MPSSVARLHRALVAALLRSRPHALTAPVTIAEIYQDLVPYRSVRSSLGFALNADYEFALLQLLAGVENLARIEPAEVREALRLELDSPNPNVGMFRGYAACDVWVTPPDDIDQMLEESRLEESITEVPAGWSTPAAGLTGAILAEAAATPSPDAASREAAPPRTAAPATPPAGEPARAASVADTVGTDATSGGGAIAAARLPSDRGAPSSGGAASVSNRPAHCRYCQSPFPTERAVRFCPQCGRDQKKQLCGSCGEELDVNWKYCITCGESAS